MSLGNGFYFAIGALSAFGLLFVVYPWLPGKSRTTLLSGLPRWVPITGAIAIVVVLALYINLVRPQLEGRDAVSLTAAPGGGPVPMANSAQKSSAGSMDSAVSGLERRLAAGGGSAGDCELLAKSY